LALQEKQFKQNFSKFEVNIRAVNILPKKKCPGGQKKESVDN